jgi:hypothetical protein
MFNLFNLIFLHPLLLWALLVLPLVYLLIRFFPPSPKRLEFPAFRFVENLQDKKTTPQTSPLWLLLLRISMLGFLIIGLAQPVLHQPDITLPDKPITLTIQNDWAAGQNWSVIKNYAASIIQQAKQQNIPVTINVTNPYAALGENITDINAIEPQPWSALTDTNNSDIILGSGGALEIADTTKLYLPKNLPLILQKTEDGFIILSTKNEDVTIALLNENGGTIDTLTTPTNTAFTLPDTAQASRLQIKGQNHAAAVYLLPLQTPQIHVGISGVETTEISPSSPEFYIQAALNKNITTSIAPLVTLLESKNSAIILPDQTLSTEVIEALNDWVSNGGLLIRFAGEAIANNPYDTLSPVTLRKNFRATDGELSAAQAPKINTINSQSPLGSLSLPQGEDIFINRQILADPRFDISDKSWVLLDDGTPLVTGDAVGKGYIVLVHTTADAAWSDFALTGFFARLLNKLVSLAPQIEAQNIAAQSSDIMYLKQQLDGFGQLQNADNDSPIEQPEGTLKASAETPPGYYDHAGSMTPLNIDDARFIDPSDINNMSYPEQQQHDLRAFFLILAMILLLLDSSLPFIRKLAHFSIFMMLLGTALPAYAQDYPQARTLNLAYVQTGDATFDQTTKLGLEKLISVMGTRTSLVADQVKSIDIANEPLAFYPILYWRIKENQTAPSAETSAKLQSYLSNGGTLFFDITDTNYKFSGSSPTLLAITEKLNVPTLQLLPKDHTLRRSFYLLPKLDTIGTGKLWVETSPIAGRDNVSSILISTYDFASLWGAEPSQTSFRRQDMSWRFGINLHMYILTGNYKTDQVHIPFILQRLEE